ncbi:unnamed protein product, partial [Rotaria magnacalcarata]
MGYCTSKWGTVGNPGYRPRLRQFNYHIRSILQNA